ncbi:MAG: zinc metalloprotease HtpX [Deltaproteobacteria bacterium]
MYKAQPLGKEDAPTVYELLELLAARAQLHCELKIYHIPSQGMNAFSVGDPLAATIALTDGLFRKLSPSELLAVMAHEISHIRNNDMRVMALADMVSRLNGLFSSVGLLLLFFSLPLLLFGKIFISLPFVLLLILAPVLSNLLQLGLSRTREYTADLDAVTLTGSPTALIRALEKMEVAQVDSGLRRLLLTRGNRLLPSLFRSHPATGKRIRRLKEVFAGFEEHPILFPGDRPGISDHLRPRRPPRRHHIGGLWY